MSLQIRRGTAAELAAIVPQSGEPIWTTDAKKLFVGDGLTLGGNLVTAAQDVSTTSNVTFANVNVTYTATVAAIRFGDGSVQTTADTANPDQSLNTTSNVKFNSVEIATTATVTVLKFADGTEMSTADTANPDQALNTNSNVKFNSIDIAADATLRGNVIVDTDLTVKEITSDKNILAATTASLAYYVNNNQAFKVDGSPSEYVLTIGSASAPANINVANDAALRIGSGVNTYNLQVQSDLLQINRPSSLGGEPRLATFTATGLTAWQNILPHQDFAINVGTTGTRFATMNASVFRSYLNSSTLATTVQNIAELDGAGLTVYAGRGPNATSNLPAANNILFRTRALGWTGFNHSVVATTFYTAAGAWANTLTSTVTNFGVNFGSAIAVPNMRSTTNPDFPVVVNWQAGQWITPVSQFPPTLEIIEGLNSPTSTLQNFSTNGAGTTSTTGIQSIRYLVNQELRLLAPPSQDTTATAAVGYNKLTFVATRQSGATASRRAVASGDYLGEIHFNGVRAGDNTGSSGSQGVKIIGQANTNYSSTNTHASLIIMTTPDGSTVPDQRLMLNAGVSTFGTDILIFKNAANSTEYFRMTAGSNKSSVQMICDTTLLVGGLNGAKYEVFTTTNITSTATQQVGYFDTAGGLQHSAKFLVQVLDSGNIHFAEISVISDGTNTWKVEYGTNTSAGALGTFSTAMNGTLAILYFAPTAPTAMEIKTVLTVL